MFGQPVGSATEEQGERRRRRRPFLLLLVLGLILLLVGGSAVMGYYVATRKPVTELPVVERATRTLSPRLVFSFAGVAKPVGVAVSPDGQRVYVAEGGGERQIKVFDREGKPVGKGGPPDSASGTRKPGLLAVDAGGRVWVADILRAQVQVYGPALEWEGPFNPPAVEAMGGWRPNGISIGPDGRVYVAETGQQEQSILVFAPDGALVDRLSAASGLPGGLSYPVQAVADDEGRVYISDGQAGRVLAVTPRGVAAVGVSGEGLLGLPRGMAVAGRRLLIADAAGHEVNVYSAEDRPQFLHAFGATEDDDGMSYPNAVAVDRTGRVYVADRVNDRIQVWSY
ncbi:MAG: NHL repeat-containing protein [Chloroflexi bacterium]|nr:NHL repeat-containing protein [Chloroflexota bacterium]